jgi:glycosyltransferase involved in cell wall biosynthesis
LFAGVDETVERGSAPGRFAWPVRERVVMLLENQPYPQDVRVRNEAQALARAGHAVMVIAPRAKGQTNREVHEGVRVWRYRLPVSAGGVVGFLAEYVVAHAQLLTRGAAAVARGATVVHLHNPPDTLFPVAILARMLGRRAIFDHHDLAPELYREKFGPSRIVESVLRSAQRASFRTASMVLVTNESQRDIALERGASPRRLTVVRNGPRAATLACPQPLREGPLRDPLLVFVGELDSQDGVLALPTLWRQVVEQRETPEARLLIVGDGACRSLLERQMRAVGAHGRVEFTGRVPHQRVPELIAQADICIDPAPPSPLNHHSTMIKVTEYLASGRPVVAYDLLETRRTAGGAALYAAGGDEQAFTRHIATLASDFRLRRSLADEGQRRARSLVWERSEERLLGAYSRLRA